MEANDDIIFSSKLVSKYEKEHDEKKILEQDKESRG